MIRTDLREAINLANERLDEYADNPQSKIGIVVDPDGPDTGVTVVHGSLGEALLDVLELADALIRMEVAEANHPEPVLALIEKWEAQGDRYGLGYYQECASELRRALD